MPTATDAKIGLPGLWQERFMREQTRLLAALGALTDGGIVEGLQPIGSVSFSDKEAAQSEIRLDIGLVVWPFPLTASEVSALEALGYAPISGYESAPEQRFRHSSDPLQLFIAEAGNEKWTYWLVLRDYLRANPESCDRFLAEKRAIAAQTEQANIATEARSALFDTTLESARQWWMATKGFAPLEEVVHELEGFAGAWHIAGGWAIDCFLGRVTRVHHDIDVLIARKDQLALQEHMQTRNWKWVTPFENTLRPWPPGMFLELPRHQAHAHRDGQMRDFLMGEITDGVWRFRRDANVLRTTERIFLRTDTGLSYIAPEIALLYKSRTGSAGLRDKDQADFDKTHPHMNSEQRAWLRWALTATNPQHPWLPTLT